MRPLEAEQDRASLLDAKLGPLEAIVAALQQDATALREGRTTTLALVERLQRGVAAEAAAQAGSVDADMPGEEQSPAAPAPPSLDLSPEQLEAAFFQHNAMALEGGTAASSTGASIGGFLAALLRDHCPPQTKRRKLPEASGLAHALPPS